MIFHIIICKLNMVLASEGDNCCIKVFDQSGTFLYKFGKTGNQDGQFNSTPDLRILLLFPSIFLMFSSLTIVSHKPFSAALKFHSYSPVV